jgi:hypothetical protein
MTIEEEEIARGMGAPMGLVDARAQREEALADLATSAADILVAAKPLVNELVEEGLKRLHVPADEDLRQPSLPVVSDHIGYAGRTGEKFRYDGDPREVHLEISAACAQVVYDAVYALSAHEGDTSDVELLRVLGVMGFSAS